MAWTTPLTAVANATLTASQWNASVRDNLNMTAPALATAAGRFFASTGANAIAERVPSTAETNSSSTTTSTSYADLADLAGPSVTVTTGPTALVAISAVLTNDGTANTSYVSFEVSGATTLSASNFSALRYRPAAAGVNIQMGRARLMTGLTAGSNTFSMRYQVDAGTGTFNARQIAVIPF